MARYIKESIGVYGMQARVLAFAFVNENGEKRYYRIGEGDYDDLLRYIREKVVEGWNREEYQEDLNAWIDAIESDMITMRFPLYDRKDFVMEFREFIDGLYENACKAHVAV